ncbi:MAG: carboxymuconolactone decarboxylase family protein [Solimonas sp.]
MARITSLADGPTELDQVWGRRPEYYAIFMKDFVDSVQRIDPVIMELCRLRIAQMVESAFDLALRHIGAKNAGLGEAKIAALRDYPSSLLFSERERIVLEFTEQWVIQSSAISDEDVERVQTVMSAEQFALLCKALSMSDQLARANSAFRLKAPAVPPPTMPGFSIAASLQ